MQYPQLHNNTMMQSTSVYNSLLEIRYGYYLLIVALNVHPRNWIGSIQVPSILYYALERKLIVWNFLHRYVFILSFTSLSLNLTNRLPSLVTHHYHCHHLSSQTQKKILKLKKFSISSLCEIVYSILLNGKAILSPKTLGNPQLISRMHQS